LISLIKEIRILALGLYSKLDDWIIYGIKGENDLVYQSVIYNNFKLKIK
jgi:hypothetical protein